MINDSKYKRVECIDICNQLNASCCQNVYTCNIGDASVAVYMLVQVADLFIMFILCPVHVQQVYFFAITAQTLMVYFITTRRYTWYTWEVLASGNRPTIEWCQWVFCPLENLPQNYIHTKTPYLLLLINTN